MPTELAISLPALSGFALVVARVTGALVLVPLPGLRNMFSPVRVALIAAVSFALFPLWPAAETTPSAGQMALWMISEAALGLSIGLPVAFLTETLLIAMQIMGMQAGYSFASMVDPGTQADSSILAVYGQLTAGLLFFSMGLDRMVLAAFAHSFETFPPGTYAIAPSLAGRMIDLSAGMFATGLRLAMPSIALLLLIDLSIALLGRINSHLQLITLAFPAKMVAVVGLIAGTAALIPGVYRGYAESCLAAMRAVLP